MVPINLPIFLVNVVPGDELSADSFRSIPALRILQVDEASIVNDFDLIHPIFAMHHDVVLFQVDHYQTQFLEVCED